VNDDERNYHIHAHLVGVDDVLPADMDPGAWFVGTHIAAVGPDRDDWDRMRLPGDPHPVLIAELHTRLFTTTGDNRLRFPPVLITVPGAALLIGSLLSAFDDVGLAVRLAAELDQVKAGWRTAGANPEQLL
jgi:hypothetical protein